MAAVTYGATAELLGDRYFPTGIMTDVQAAATDAIEEVANEINMHVRAAKVEPDSITAGHSPAAYRWLQDAILLGAAARFATRIGSGDVDAIDAWREDYRSKVTDMRNNSNVILGDVTARRQRVRSSYCFR